MIPTLFKNRHFPAYFFTQFLGAFNDNIYKNALLILIAFHWSQSTSEDHLVINLAAGLFILPFLLLSPLAGQLADFGNKIRLIQRLKLFEVLLMIAASVAMLYASVNSLLLILFLMGCQSSLFGPVKYALLPEISSSPQLINANAFVSASTYVAILLGTLAGGLLAGKSITAVALGITFFSACGWLSSLKIPPLNVAPRKTNSDPTMSSTLNIRQQFCSVFQVVRQQPSMKRAILFISWFWLQGAAYLTQIPTIVRDVLNGNASTVSLLLGLFTLSIACGAALYALTAKGEIKTSLIRLGAGGLLLGGLSILLADSSLLKVSCSFIIIGLSAGLYIVPLYTCLQRFSLPETRARIIAANNILNAIFMITAALLGMLLLGKLNLPIPVFLALISIGNLVPLYLGFHLPKTVEIKQTR